MHLGQKALRFLLLVLGVISLALGVAGIFLPLLPTTPFVLLAGWCFMKSSERFHNWILNHKMFGPMIHNWQERGAIPVSAKMMAAFVVFLSLLSIWIFVKILVVKCCVTLLLTGVMVFVFTRPSA